MYEIVKSDREGNYLLEDLNGWIEEDMTGTVINVSKEFQETFIKENVCTFADMTTRVKEILELQHKTVTLINKKTGEEKEVTFEIEGGI